MVPPDNRSGSLVIGIGNCLFYIACFLWYLTSNSFGAPISESLTFTNLDISVFVIFLVQLVVNLLLIVGAVRRLPSHIFPWICANAVFCGICMIGIVVTIFWGTTKLGLNHSDYVSVLTILGLITGINLFCVIVVFQFRHNTLLEERIALETGVEVTLPCGSAPPLPPPSYDEGGEGEGGGGEEPGGATEKEPHKPPRLVRSFPPFLQPESLLGDPVRTYKLRPVPRIIIERLPLLPRCQCLMLSAPDSCLGRKAVSEWMRLFFSCFALNELDVGLFVRNCCLYLLSKY